MGRRTKAEEAALFARIDIALDAGEDHRSIAERLGCSTNTVTHRRKARGMKGTPGAKPGTRRTPRTSNPPPSIAQSIRANETTHVSSSALSVPISSATTAAVQRAADEQKAARAAFSEAPLVHAPALDIHAGDKVILDRAVLQIARINSDGTLRLIRLNGVLFAESVDPLKVVKR